MKNQYEAVGWVKFGEEDIYKEGCIPNMSFGDRGNDVFSGATLEEVITKCQEFAGSYDKDDAYPASKHEISLWKRGKIKLFDCIYSFRIYHVSREAVSLSEVNK